MELVGASGPGTVSGESTEPGKATSSSAMQINITKEKKCSNQIRSSRYAQMLKVKFVSCRAADHLPAVIARWRGWAAARASSGRRR